MRRVGEATPTSVASKDAAPSTRLFLRIKKDLTEHDLWWFFMNELGVVDINVGGRRAWALFDNTANCSTALQRALQDGIDLLVSAEVGRDGKKEVASNPFAPSPKDKEVPTEISSPKNKEVPMK
jgi:hypothetical protein